MTPREKDGKTYVLFKENGRVSYVVPVYEEDIIPETFWEIAQKNHGLSVSFQQAYKVFKKV